MKTLREIWAYREVIWLLTVRNVKVRYRRSVLGFLWSFLNPLFRVAILFVVFKYMWGFKEPDYSAKLFAALVPWMFFAQSLGDGAGCISGNISLVRNIYLPRIILPMVSLLSNFIHFLAGMAVLLIVFVIRPTNVNWQFFAVLLPLAVLIVLTFGLMLIVATIGVYYGDTRFLLDSALMMLFSMSPVLVPATRVLEQPTLPQWAKQAYLLNPLAPILSGFRGILLWGGGPPFPGYYTYLGIAAAVAAVALVVGLRLFLKHQSEFVERA